MKRFYTNRLAGLAALALLGAVGHAQPGPTANPVSIAFTYTVNGPLQSGVKLVGTSPAGSGLPVAASVSSTPMGWLLVSPSFGASPATFVVNFNPTGLAPGSYSGSVILTTMPPGVNSTTVPVTLTISNGPSSLIVSSADTNYTPDVAGTLASFRFAYTTGTPPTVLPASSTLNVASSGDIIPFSVTCTNAAKGTVWLRVNQNGSLPAVTTSAVAAQGSTVPVSITIDPVAVSTLDPGSYTGVVAVAASNAINGGKTVQVFLTVAAGPPTLVSPKIFPSTIVAGIGTNPTFTLFGDNFVNNTAVNFTNGVQTFDLSPSVLSHNVLQVTVNKGFFAIPAGVPAYPITWTVTVSNPKPGSNPLQGGDSVNITVTDPTIPSIDKVANAASYLSASVFSGTGTNPVTSGQMAVSPREIISIFGHNLGPVTPSEASPSGSPNAYPINFNGLEVRFLYGSSPVQTAWAPIIMIASNQVNCIVPVGIGVGTTAQVEIVLNGAVFTNLLDVVVLPEDPALFTFGGQGQGQAAVLNFDTTTASYSINSKSNAAARGTPISIYVTGMGDIVGSVSTLPDGAIADRAYLLNDGTYRVDIDGQPAVVSYAGTSALSVVGLVQVNAVVPKTSRTGASVPISVSIGSVQTARQSQTGVTIAVK